MRIKLLNSFGVTWKRALELAKKEGTTILTNSEIDQLLRSGEYKIYPSLFPCWTSTYVEYEDENCIVTENGKRKNILLPLQNGWYKKDVFGIPSGEASDSFDQEARYLSRTKRYQGPVTRGYSRELTTKWHSRYELLNFLGSCIQSFVGPYYHVRAGFGVCLNTQPSLGLAVPVRDSIK
jgi:hypothetical protein